MGRVVDFLGRPYPMQHAAGGGGGNGAAARVAPHPEAEADAAAVPPLGADQQLPLLNGQPDMDSREQICEPLLTGVRVRLG